MLEFAHEIIVWWEGGTSAIITESYQACWDLADQVWQEREFFKPDPRAGEMIGVSCKPTQIITASPMAELRP